MTWSSRYETIAEIGTGGMATVWVGRVAGSEHLVALKRAHAHVKSDPKAYEAMIREANLAARVRHPNVVGVLDVDQVDGDLVIVLDYVEGCTLRLLTTRLEEQRLLRPRETIRILLDTAAGLHAAHQSGLIHRDISPSNILIGSDGLARLADFGIAKAEFEGSGAGERTATGVLKGKLAYMAPEYLMYQRVDASSDLFSFAVCAWESITGRRLFKGDSDLETLANIADASFRPISKEVPELVGFDDVFARALAKEPERRQASVEEFAYELESVARSYDLVSSHAEVASLVELLAEPELHERRALVGEVQTNVARVSRAPQAPAPAKMQVQVPPDIPSADLPTQIHTARRAPTVQVRAAASTSPSHPPGASNHPGHVAAPTIRARRNTHAEAEATREKLALVGALMLLALVLGWMWTQLRNQDPPRRAYLDAGSSPAVQNPAVRPMTTPLPDRGNTPRQPGR